MKSCNRKLARRLARLAFNLDWAKGAADAARGWVAAGEADSFEGAFCIREALNGARAAVREAESIERALQSARKGRP